MTQDHEHYIPTTPSIHRPPISALSIYLSQTGGADMTQCSHFPGRTIIRSTTSTSGMSPSRILQLGGRESAAGLLLQFEASGRIAPIMSLAVTYREDEEPDLVRLYFLWPFDVIIGTLVDGTRVRCLLYGVQEGVDEGVDTVANGVYVWPEDDERPHTKVGGGSLVSLFY